jgi:hypothetical protein
MRSNAHVRPLAAEIHDLIDQIIECCAGHDYELEILQRVWREAEQAFCKARHEARTLSCTERNSHDPRDAA